NQGQVEVVLRVNEQGGEVVAQVLLLSLKTELQEVRLDGVSSDLIGSLDLSLRGPAGGLEPQGVVANGFHSLIEGRHGVGLKVQLHAVRQAHKLLVQVTGIVTLNRLVGDTDLATDLADLDELLLDVDVVDGRELAARRNHAGALLGSSRASAEQLVENQRATGSRGGGVQVLREKVIADLLGDVSGDTGRFVEHLLNSDSAVRVLVNIPRELGGKELLCFSHKLRSLSSSQQRRRNRCWRRRLRYQRR